MSGCFSGLKQSWDQAAMALRHITYQTPPAPIAPASAAENAVRLAMVDDYWEPTEKQLKDVARFTNRSRRELLDVYEYMFDKVLNNDTPIRTINKGLIVFEYLLLNGSGRFVVHTFVQNAAVRNMANLVYMSKNGKERGKMIRKRVRNILELLGDQNGLIDKREVREKINKERKIDNCHDPDATDKKVYPKEKHPKVLSEEDKCFTEDGDSSQEIEEAVEAQ